MAAFHTKKRRLTAGEREWVRGYGCAAALVSHNQGYRIAQELLKQGNISKLMLVEAKTEPSDIETIFPHLTGFK